MGKRIIFAEDALAQLARDKAYMTDVGYIHARAAVNSAETVDAVVLPCKVGDYVWGIKRWNRGIKAIQSVVTQMYIVDDMRLSIVVKGVCRGEWGRNVFATKEEAEAAIGERRADHETRNSP